MPYYFGGAYEVTGSNVKKYYSFAGGAVGTPALHRTQCGASVRDANGLQYFLTDHLGSVDAITNDSGTLTSQQRYLPFGQERADVGSIGQTDYGYTGQRDNSYIKLLDLNFRWMDPYLNRWTQPDTIVPDPSNPQSLNRYSYVANRPINFNDPTGNCARDASPDDCFTPGKKYSASDYLNVNGYSPWERSILKKLYDKGGPDAVHGVDYILANDVHIKVGEPYVCTPPGGRGKIEGSGACRGDWQSAFSVEGWFDPKSNTLVLNPNRGYSSTSMPSTWGLATIIHEAKHLEQGAPLTQYDELEAMQIGIRVAINLGGYYGGTSGQPGQQPSAGSRDAQILALTLSHDPAVIHAYSGILFATTRSYWWGFMLLPLDTPHRWYEPSPYETSP